MTLHFLNKPNSQLQTWLDLIEFQEDDNEEDQEPIFSGESSLYSVAYGFSATSIPENFSLDKLQRELDSVSGAIQFDQEQIEEALNELKIDVDQQELDAFGEYYDGSFEDDLKELESPVWDGTSSTSTTSLPSTSEESERVESKERSRSLSNTRSIGRSTDWEGKNLYQPAPPKRKSMKVSSKIYEPPTVEKGYNHSKVMKTNSVGRQNKMGDQSKQHNREGKNPVRVNNKTLEGTRKSQKPPLNQHSVGEVFAVKSPGSGAALLTASLSFSSTTTGKSLDFESLSQYKSSPSLPPPIRPPPSLSSSSSPSSSSSSPSSSSSSLPTRPSSPPPPTQTTPTISPIPPTPPPLSKQTSASALTSSVGGISSPHQTSSSNSLSSLTLASNSTNDVPTICEVNYFSPKVAKFFGEDLRSTRLSEEPKVVEKKKSKDLKKKGSQLISKLHEEIRERKKEKKGPTSGVDSSPNISPGVHSGPGSSSITSQSSSSVSNSGSGAVVGTSPPSSGTSMSSLPTLSPPISSSLPSSQNSSLSTISSPSISSPQVSSKDGSVSAVNSNNSNSNNLSIVTNGSARSVVPFGNYLKIEGYPDLLFSIPNHGSFPLVAGGTPQALTDRLSTESDPHFLECFLLMYRSFLSPHELLSGLMSRFCQEKDPSEQDTQYSVRMKTTRLRLFNVFKIWIGKYFNLDFAENNELLQELIEFISSLGESISANQLSNHLNKQIASYQKQMLEEEAEEKKRREEGEGVKEKKQPMKEKTVYINSIPHMVSTPCTLLDCAPIDVAMVLTEIESELFRKIKPQECLEQRWTKPNKYRTSPNVLSMISRFNHVSSWVATLIVNEQNLKDRARTLNHFLLIAKELIGLQNFNGVMEMLAGLTCMSIFRLKQTWTLLPVESVEIWNSITALTSTNDNFAMMRNTLKKAVGPVVPYLGLFLTDITFIQDGNPDCIPGTGNQYINFHKLRTVGTVILSLQMFQQVIYNCTNNTSQLIKEFVHYTEPLDEKELYRLSLEIEPKAPKKRPHPSS